MKPIPTAEEQLQETLDKLGISLHKDTKQCVIEDMIEFAKLHVKAALDRAYHNQGMSWTNSKDEEVKKELFVKNSYPVSKIV